VTWVCLAGFIKISIYLDDWVPLKNLEKFLKNEEII